jgi:hypothetical protein
VAEVVSLADAKAARTLHLEGPAQCVGCRHEWQAVAPVGVEHLECPACGLHKGLWAKPVQRGEQIWRCNCGGELFRIAPHVGPYCANCGAEQTGWF